MDYLHLLRVKHYIKNFLIFIPLFFSGRMLDVVRNISSLSHLLFGFVSFCLTASAVYIINDLKDYENDRNHPTKKNRPLPSGRVSLPIARVLLTICLCISLMLQIPIANPFSTVILLLYLLLNISYSFGLKDKPIIDVVLLASGFVLRIIFGGVITGTPISNWLFLTVLAGSLYMGLGKRRNELVLSINSNGSTRKVLQFYSFSFLDKNMYVTAGLVNVFFALWAIGKSDKLAFYTVPVFIVFMMRYSYDVEGSSEGDPIEVITGDTFLLLLGVMLAVLLCVFIYLIK